MSYYFVTSVLQKNFLFLNLFSIYFIHNIQVKESVSIPVVANGDIKCETDVVKVYEQTGVNGRLEVISFRLSISG